MSKNISNLIKAVKGAAAAATANGSTYSEIATLAAKSNGLLFVQIARAIDGGAATEAVATAATEGGYKADGTTTGKLARAGRILLLDKPGHDTDEVLARGDEARKAVNNAVRVGVVLDTVDSLIAAAPCTDEAIKALVAAAKAARDAKAAADEAEAEAAVPSGDDAIVATSQWLDAAAKNLNKALTQGVVTEQHLAVLRAIAEAAGAAAMLVEAAEAVAA